ncbi:MAG TPA: 50S ribosomal protein L4 [Actinomycetota bacterium]|nr:50S ribosomal protein L4 [Actinomycetota bacterium]
MATVPVRGADGSQAGEATLAPEIFEAQVNVPVMHQVVVAQMAARRSGTHDTKTRGEVRGGGRKPYRQKGTGRARQGSIRAPHYVGGGTVFGPHPRDYSVKVPKKMRAAALRSALSDRAKDGKVVVIDQFAFDKPSTKGAVSALESAGASGKVLVVLDRLDETIGLSFRNLQRAHVITIDQLNTYDVLARDYVVFTKVALEKLNARGLNGSDASASEEPETEAPESTAGGETA